MNVRQRRALAHPLQGWAASDVPVVEAQRVVDRESRPPFSILSVLAVDR
jgi:hypothetical protein